MIIIPDGKIQEEGNYFVLLSLDRKPINDKKYFTKEELIEAAEEWANGFKEQGFYPHGQRNIPYKYIFNDLIVMECDKEGDHYDDFEFYWFLPDGEQFSYIKCFLE